MDDNPRSRWSRLLDEYFESQVLEWITWTALSSEFIEHFWDYHGRKFVVLNPLERLVMSWNKGCSMNDLWFPFWYNWKYGKRCHIALKLGADTLLIKIDAVSYFHINLLFIFFLEQWTCNECEKWNYLNINHIFH